MRILFMGTPEFAVPSLNILADRGYQVAAVVTVPDRPRGRGQKTQASPVKVAALSRSIPVLQPEDLSHPSFISELRAIAPDLIVVVAFRILPPAVFQLPPKGTFNLHASLLPKYRGAAPIARAIMNGESETGVTTFLLQERVDTGSILLQARVRIGPDETAGELHDKLAEVGAEIVLQTVRLIELGKAEPRPQNDSQATSAPKIFKEDCRIDWSRPANVIHNFVRGLSPVPGAWCMLNGVLVRVFRTSRTVSGREGQGVAHPGVILRADDGSLTVQTGDGPIAILELQQEGRKRMGVAEFLRGFALREGDRFGD